VAALQEPYLKEHTMKKAKMKVASRVKSGNRQIDDLLSNIGGKTRARRAQG